MDLRFSSIGRNNAAQKTDLLEEMFLETSRSAENLKTTWHRKSSFNG